MNLHANLPAINAALLLSLLCMPADSLQSPMQPGKLVIESAPKGASITVNGRAINQPTDATFVVPPGSYAVSVTGGPGNVNCKSKDVPINSGQTVTVRCVGNDWAQ